MSYADLHLHTNFSDGTYTPEELAAQGKRYGFRALALSDHDTVEGCERMAAACASEGIEFIPASELTAELDGHELHLLGYYLDT
jgi:predicted metal-dependent phosphoesterase TrpH